VKGQNAFNFDPVEMELLAADVLYDEAVAIDDSPSHIRVIIEVTKQDSAGATDRVV
jgi:hypothetical protein